VAPTATFYPQCQNDNLIEFVGGNALFNIAVTDFQQTNTDDAVTCCELCANTADCSGFSGPTPGFTDCFIFLATTCDASTSTWTVFFGGSTSDFDIVGNGNCGQGTYGGNAF